MLYLIHVCTETHNLWSGSFSNVLLLKKNFVYYFGFESSLLFSSDIQIIRFTSSIFRVYRLQMDYFSQFVTQLILVCINYELPFLIYRDIDESVDLTRRFSYNCHTNYLNPWSPNIISFYVGNKTAMLLACEQSFCFNFSINQLKL